MMTERMIRSTYGLRTVDKLRPREPQILEGAMEVKAIDISPGDRLACEDGTSRKVKKIQRASWITTAEGPCVWLFFTDGGDGVFGKSDVFEKVA